MRRLHFDKGTLLLEGFPDGDVPDGFQFDSRVQMWRAPAMHYPRVALDLHRRKLEWEDHARAFTAVPFARLGTREPREYQAEALRAWLDAGRRGVVVLPTGAGKSFVAELAIAATGRSACVVAPTLDLVGQWYDGLRRAFGVEVGVVGGGDHEVRDLTVTTYDSAWLHVARHGNRFGLIIWDEVHHLPSASYGQSAELSLAPFRLGLTATPEREDHLEARLDTLVGPVVYRKSIRDLSGSFLAPYRTELVEVALSPAERQAHDEAFAVYRGFKESAGVRGWDQFVRASARSAEGRLAFKAWLQTRRILQGNEAKLAWLEELLRRHAGERVLVFTSDNATVYRISRELLVPAITHKTPVKERSRLLEDFAAGVLPVLVTSRVLNEGVDLPAAEVAVVLSGTGTVREHVQRLGRILRPSAGKQAVLYELVVEGSAEENTSRRRREHDAYRDDEGGEAEG